MESSKSINPLGATKGLNHIPAIILCGGLGTRLRTSIPDKPKVLAPLLGRPFLSFLLDQLIKAGIRNVILSIGYLGEQIVDFYGDQYQSIRIVYSAEEEPLGTAGALVKASGKVGENIVLIMNGDTYVDCPLNLLADFFEARRAAICLAVVPVENTARYGCITLGQEDRILSFGEKETQSNSSWINSGLAILRRDLFSRIPDKRPCSLEYDCYPKWIRDRVSFSAFRCHGRFIDIGTPESYAAAKELFSNHRLPG